MIKGADWEDAFKQHHASWKTFYAKTKQLEEWILGAQKIVLETNEDLNYLIQKHKVWSFWIDLIYKRLCLNDIFYI